MITYTLPEKNLARDLETIFATLGKACFIRGLERSDETMLVTIDAFTHNAETKALGELLETNACFEVYMKIIRHEIKPFNVSEDLIEMMQVKIEWLKREIGNYNYNALNATSDEEAEENNVKFIQYSNALSDIYRLSKEVYNEQTV